MRRWSRSGGIRTGPADLTRRALALSGVLALLAGEGTAQVVLEPGQWVQGVLESSDLCDRGGPIYDRYDLPPDFQGLARITVESGDFDTVAEWGVMGGGHFLAVSGSDDAEGLTHETDSRLYAVVLPGERAHLRVTSWMDEGRGDYRVRWDPVPMAAALPEEVAFGADVRGTLEEGDAFVDGSFEDRFRLRGEAGTTLRVMLESDEFDVFLELWGPSGDLVTSDDDGLGLTNAWIEMELPESGDYEIRVRSYLLQTGTYRLRISPFDEAN